MTTPMPSMRRVSSASARARSPPSRPLAVGSLMATSATITSFPIRLMGALALDPTIYEEVEADPRATGQALLVVLMSSASAGIGALGWGYGAIQGILFISGLA